MQLKSTIGHSNSLSRASGLLLVLVLLGGCGHTQRISPRAHRLDATATVHVVTRSGTGETLKGSLSGTLYASLTIVINAVARTATFTATAANGTLSGAVYPPSYSLISFRGSCEVTSGTGIFSSVLPSRLLATGRLSRTFAISSVKLTGVLYY
jgi:hypothetical protein